MAKNKKNTKFSTKSIHTGNRIDETGATVTPLHLTSTFRQPSFSSSEKFVYSRTGGPTIDALEENFAMLEDAKFSFAFASGMAAMSAIFLMFKPGDHVLISQNVYGGVFRLVTKVLNDNGVNFDFIDTTDLKIIKQAIRPTTKLIHLETPSNPLLEIADISSISKVCKSKNILVSVDNTFMSPYGQKPLNLGADIVMHSTTKYIGGHSDVMMGVTVCNKKYLNLINRWKRNSGQCVGPDDIFLALRGLRTLPLRLKQSQENSIKLAHFLTKQKEVKKVYHPALKEHPDHKLWKRDFNGACGIFGIEFKDYITTKMAEFFADNCLLFGKGASWGGYESLMTMTDIKSNRTINTSYVPKGEYLRIYVGIENIEDILDDVRDSFTKMRKKFK